MELLDVSKLIRELPVKAETRIYLTELLLEMGQVENEKKGWGYRFEVQGVINGLATEGVITEAQRDTISETVGEIWKPIARSLAVARLKPNVCQS